MKKQLESIGENFHDLTTVFFSKKKHVLLNHLIVPVRENISQSFK